MKRFVFVLWIIGLSLYAQKTPHQDQEIQQSIDPESQWFKERMKFNRAEWDAEEKKIFTEKLKEKEKEFNGDKMHQELAIAFAQEWATCSMREKFRTEKGSLAIKKSVEHGKEMKKYWDEIYDRCDKARWRYYRISKALKKQDQDKRKHKQNKD